MPESEHKLILQVISRLVRVQAAIPDLFFQRRIAEQTQTVLESYIQYQLDKTRRADYVQALKATIQVLEDVGHLEVCPDQIGLHLAQERLWYTIRELLSKKFEPVVKPQPRAVSLPNQTRDKVSKLNSTSAKILDFVRKAPERRTKEIIEEFNALSGRTVKRSLKELSREGLIVRKADSKAVYYSAV